MGVLEQYAFWSQHDVIVAAHGAALTNAIFLPPGGGSAVIEIFPPHFYDTDFYGTLLKRSGIRGYGYYNDVTDIAADFAAHTKTHSEVIKYREQNLSPPVEAIIDLVKQALADGGYGPRGNRKPVWGVPETIIRLGSSGVGYHNVTLITIQISVSISTIALTVA
jgi:Glycosyltransferase 61